jgi:GNAT superfamily N-acetyltransferase
MPQNDQMIDVHRDLSPAALVRAIEDNSADLLMEMGRAGGGEQREEPGLRWTIGGSPIDYHNCVVRADLSPTDVQEVIAASIQRMHKRGVPGTWHVGPSMRPTDLAERLRSAGLTLGSSEPGMAADLHTLRDDLPSPGGLRVERVRDEAGLTAWSQTLAQGFGEGEREATWVAATYRALGFHADNGPWLHYLARLNGRPVGTSTVFLGAGVAGVYFVSTVPEARGCGIGAASTLAGLMDARQLGYRIGILTSSTMGNSVYARLGFRDYCTIDLFEAPLVRSPIGLD